MAPFRVASPRFKDRRLSEIRGQFLDPKAHGQVALWPLWENAALLA